MFSLIARFKWLALSGVLALSACADSGVAGSDRQGSGVTTVGVVANAESNCGNLSYEQCEQVYEVISLLAPGCYANLVSTALVNGNLNFEEGEGYGRVDAISGTQIWLRPLAFTAGELMNTLAHEGAHLGGLTHPAAYDVGDACAGDL